MQFIWKRDLKNYKFVIALAVKFIKMWIVKANSLIMKLK